MTLGHATGDLGPWMRSPASFTDPEAPPHRRPGEPLTGGVPLFVVYGDAERTVIVAVQDWDGCQALVRSVDTPK